MADVVISYARDQEPMAGTVARALEADGYSVWWDHDIPAHKAYAALIEEKFHEAKAVIVIWSAGAVQSEWVRAEADLARSQQKLIQVSVQGTTPPLPFSQIQFAALQAWDGSPDHPEWRRVRASLRTLCGGEAPDPRPTPAPPNPLPMPPKAPARRPPMLAVIAVALLAVAVGAHLFTQFGPQAKPQPEPPVIDDRDGPPAPPPPGPTPAAGDFVLPDSSTRLLTADDVMGLDAAKLRIARNEIYARHGRIFNSPDLAAHFAKFAWYRPVPVYSPLSTIEQANVDLLVLAERELATR